jgi:short-subunit dehydrogenase
MASRGRGHLVFVSSLAAAFSTPGLTVYNATKAALSSYGLSLRGELRPLGVGVSVIHPGPISEAGMWADTGMTPPVGLRTRSPSQVGSAVVRAIEEDRAEIAVASMELSVGALLARAAPGLFARLAQRLGASDVTGSMAKALQDRR